HKTKTIRNHIKDQQNKRWKDFEQVILDYYTKCVYEATRLKEDYENKMKEQKIDLSFPPDNDALHQVQTVGLFKHLCDDHSHYEFLVGLNTLFDDFSSFTSTDLCNLEKICDGKNKKCEQTVKKVQQNNASKWQRINQMEKTLTGFGFEQDLIPYVFPKYSAEGLCKICYFYYIHNLHDQFSNKNFTITKTTPLINTPLILSALQIFFGHNEFHEGQQSSIESFIENKNTLVTMPTASLMKKGLTLVFSPLKALIEDQVIELICMGIPCAGLYAATENSHLYQEKVAAEIALKLT
ncbi:4105_t:CDS:2, partial [Entrophospora sp. SA101]